MLMLLALAGPALADDVRLAQGPPDAIAALAPILAKHGITPRAAPELSEAQLCASSLDVNHGCTWLYVGVDPCPYAPVTIAVEEHADGTTSYHQQVRVAPLDEPALAEIRRAAPATVVVAGDLVGEFPRIASQRVQAYELGRDLCAAHVVAEFRGARSDRGPTW